MRFVRDPSSVSQAKRLLLFGRRQRLTRATLGAVLRSEVTDGMLAAMIGTGDLGDIGRTSGTWLDDGGQKLIIGVLPDHCSRHNAPSRAWAIPGIVRAAGSGPSLGIVAVVDDVAHVNAVACAIASALPTFSATSKTADRTVDVLILGPDGAVVDLTTASVLADATRRAADLVDQPPDVLNPDTFVAAARSVVRELPGVSIHVVQGHALKEQGLGGLYGVGQASVHPPALVVLDHAPDNATESITLVGKGITYDTGGLSIKSKTGMPGMKTDMGGAAAVLAAFEALVRLKSPIKLTAILCLAENSVGPMAIRPDDVLHMLSGKTVEVNNTDAEGRLVLADGVAWAVKYRQPSVLIDLATLTGAQLVATGRLHAAVMSNDAELEAAAIRAGRDSGQLTHAVPYAPELFRREFASAIADMKNSVKDRSNAQTSCAGQFIGNHLGDYAGAWLHVDMAGPATSGGRGTGYGPALLWSLTQHLAGHRGPVAAGTLGT